MKNRIEKKKNRNTICLPPGQCGQSRQVFWPQAQHLPEADTAPKEAQDVLELDVGAALPLGTPSGNSRKLDPGLPTSGLRKGRSNSQTSGLFNEVFSSIITLGQ